MNNNNILLVKSLLIVQYISLYSKFEKKLVELFHDEIKLMDHREKNKLYFMHGAFLSSNIIYQYDSESFELNGSKKIWKFDDKCIFNTLNLNKILRFDRKENLIKKFKFDIHSIQKPLISFDFKDSCLKLLRMRNKLAHEFDNLHFDEKCVIENLSDNFINNKIEKYSWLSNYDNESMDEISKSLFSNYIYMDILYQEL